jgi:Glyoxalase superfamily protein
MRIYQATGRTKGSAKRLRKVLRELCVEITHIESLNLAVRLLGWRHWEDFLARDLNADLSPLDGQLSDIEFALRDDFQMNVLACAGLGPIARELLDRANPTGSWAKQTGGTAENQARSEFTH